MAGTDLSPGEIKRRLERLEARDEEVRRWQLAQARREGGIQIVAFLLGGAAGSIVGTVIRLLTRG